MYFFISLWIYNVVNVYSYVLRDTYNKVLLKDADSYKVDLIIREEDFEMFDKKQLKGLKIFDKKYKHKFDKFEAIIKAENNKTLKAKIKSVVRPTVKIPTRMTTVNLDPYQDLNQDLKDLMTKTTEEDYSALSGISTTVSIPMLVITDKKYQVMTTYIGPFNKKRRLSSLQPEDNSDYDYDYLANEYYYQVSKEAKYNDTYHLKVTATTGIPDYGPLYSLKRMFSLRPAHSNCTDYKGIGLQAIVCLMDNYNTQKLTVEELSAKSWQILKIWCLVYFAIAVPFWCTRGWCCCCLCCKFCNPRQTIEEAKKFVIHYPPGTYKTKNGDIRYNPSEREKECYEEFEHFIKTL